MSYTNLLIIASIEREKKRAALKETTTTSSRAQPLPICTETLFGISPWQWHAFYSPGKACLQVVVVLRRQLCAGGSGHLCVVLLHQSDIDSNLSRLEGRILSEVEVLGASELTSEPQERLLELIVALGADLEVLETLLAVELDGLDLHLTILDIDLVAAKHHGDLLADTDKITVPVGNVLVSYTRGNIEHDDGALTLNVVAITKATKALLAGSIPHIEADLTAGGGESQRVNDDTNGGKILLLELTSDVTLDEGGLSHTTITHKNALESRNLRSCHFTTKKLHTVLNERTTRVKKIKTNLYSKLNRQIRIIHRNIMLKYIQIFFWMSNLTKI